MDFHQSKQTEKVEQEQCNTYLIKVGTDSKSSLWKWMKSKLAVSVAGQWGECVYGSPVYGLQRVVAGERANR